MRSWLGAAVVLGVVGMGAPAHALEAFCTHVDFCGLVPRQGGNPVYNHPGLPGFNANLPWVIGGNSVVSLTGGVYSVGPGALGPSIFVVEDGRLEMVDQTADVQLPANIFLCDNATFYVDNATWRTNGTGPFAYSLWADHNSTVLYSRARLASLEAGLEALGRPGALLQVMQGSSSLIAVPPMAGAHSVEMVRFGDAWELAVTENGTANVDAFLGFAETYVAGQATLNMGNSSWFDVFFEMCPGLAETLPALPDLCSLDGSTGPQCITPAHQPINFSLGPPATTFTLTLVNDHVFSWALSTYPGSNASLTNAGPNTNLGIGIGGLTGVINARAVPGAAPVLAGITDRTITLNNVTVGVWHMWPVAGIDLTLADSSVGDFAIPDHAHGQATNTYFTAGILTAGVGAQVTLVDSAVNEPVDLNGSMWLRSSAVGGSFSVGGQAWAADTLLLDANGLTLRPGGRFHSLSLGAPVDNAMLGATTPVVGSVDAVDDQGVVTPFPPAVLELRQGANVVATLATLTAPVNNNTLAQLNPLAFPEGTYQLRLSFQGAGAPAYAQRTVTLVHPAGGSSSSGGPVSSSAGASSSVGTATSLAGSSSVGVATSTPGSGSSGGGGSSAVSAGSSAPGSSSSVAASSSAGASSAAVVSSSRAPSSAMVASSGVVSSSRASSTAGGSSSVMGASSAGGSSGAAGTSSSTGGDDGDNPGCVCAVPSPSSAVPLGAVLLLGMARVTRRRRHHGHTAASSS